LGSFDLWFVIIIVSFSFIVVQMDTFKKMLVKILGVYKIGWIYKKMLGFIKLGEFIKKCEKDYYYTFWFFFFTFMKEIKKATAQKIANSNKQNQKLFWFWSFFETWCATLFFWESRSSLCGVFFVRNNPNTKNRIAR